MKFFSGIFLAFALLLGVPASADNVPLKQPGHWAHEYTGRRADPAIVFGTLPNGLRYAIKHHETPSNGVAMRLRIGSGSMQERDDEQGLAHFLEHMAFRGSANIPDGDMTPMLERQGLTPGADSNAFTMQEQTVYTFTFPKADATAIDTGFTIFREIGERLTLTPAAVDAERGVILSEERLRDEADYRVFRASLDNALAGTRAVSRWPIGLIDTIRTATPEQLRRYYQANYRPDNATIIVVGNIDPARIEAEIKARFGDWNATGKKEDVALGTPKPPHTATELIASGVSDEMVLSWVRPLDRRADTEAVEQERLVQLIGLTILNNRLADRADRPGSPFVTARVAMAPSFLGSASVTQITILAAADRWRAALDATIEEQRQLLEQGASPEDLTRAITTMQIYLRGNALATATRDGTEIADALVDAVNEDQVVNSPAQTLAFAETVFEDIEPDDVIAALRLAFAGTGPVLFRAAQSLPATTEALEAALAHGYAGAVETRETDAEVEWPYLDFGRPGTIRSRTEDQELGVTIVEFENNARLIVKRTAYEENAISVTVRLGNGRSGADPALVHALWATEFMTLGGTSRLRVSDINRWMQRDGKDIGVVFMASDRAFELSGTTRPQDLTSQMQLLAAIARDPGFRPELGEKLAVIAPMYGAQIEASPGSVYFREVWRLATGGSDRYTPWPSQAAIDATRPADLPSLLRAELAGPADVTIVGDLPVEAAIAATRQTFAAGEPRRRQTLPVPRTSFPADRGRPFVVTHGGRADQAYYGEYWSLPDYFDDPPTSYVAVVAAAILQARLREVVRDRLGLTYSLSVDALSPREVPTEGFIGLAVEIPPENFGTLHDLLAEQLRDLSTRRIGDDELERSRRPLIEANIKMMESNGYWAARLPALLREPRLRTAILEEASATRSVTAEAVQAFFRQFMAGVRPVTIIARSR